jgi:uncharacterized protein
LSTDVTIRRDVSGNCGRSVIRTDGGEAGLTWPVTTPGLVIAYTAAVPDRFRGTGAGSALVARLVEQGRRKGFKAILSGPLVNAQRKKHCERMAVLAVRLDPTPSR